MGHNRGMGAGDAPGKRSLPLATMAIFSCWNGSWYELFSSHEEATARAKTVIKDFRDQDHPAGFTPALNLVDEGSPIYWHKPAHTKEKTIAGEVHTIQVGFEESPGCTAGDHSPEVAAAVAEWWRARDAAWSAANA